MAGLRASAAIVLLSVVAAVAYGVAHDLVTAHVCVEYFSEFHPRVLDTDSPVALALFWGVFATWWMGAAGGVVLAVAARAGSRPTEDARGLVRPVAVTLGAAGAAAVVFGLVGLALGAAGVVVPAAWIAERIPPERHVAFLADLWAHNASYAAAAIGTIVVAVRTWRRRGRAAAASAG